MFFQEVTPDTSAYMIAGYAVFTAILGVYLLSLYIRSRNLQRDLKMLEAMAAEKRPTAPRPKAPARAAVRKRTARGRKR